MCRATFEGGRRCPSHTNPVLIAAYNAKRRERYAARKLQPETTHVGVPVPPATANPNVHPLFKDGGYRVADSSQGLENLNLTQETVEGALVENGYFSDKVTHGVINYNNITPESYKEFGFEDPSDSFQNQKSFTVQEMMDLSELELEGLNPHEKQGLRYFTSSGYRWMNEALYSGEVESTTVENKDYSIFNEDPWATNARVDNYDENALHQLCNAIDSAMEKAPKKQRIVYRGMSLYNKVFGKESEFDDPYNYEERSAALSKWIDENLKLGQEIKFDGYQSSTPHKGTATNYAGQGGLVYEILTSEGINVTSISHFSNEREVLLPRDARYMVVGVNEAEDSGGSEYKVVQLVAINESGAVLDGTNTSPLADLPKAK